jgi:NADH-quinone oxidoreductase subunit M
MQKAFFAERGERAAEPHEPLPPISFPERLGAVILIGASVIVGVYPQLLLRIITPALESPLFEGLRTGRWQ